MPKAGSHATIARQWELLKILGKYDKTSRQLRDELEQRGFPVTMRTVERDLEELASQFPILCNDKGVPYGWKWAPDTHFNIPALSLPDSLSLYLLEKYLKNLVPVSLLDVLEPEFKAARNKLDSLAEENSLARWKDKVRLELPWMPFLPPRVGEGILESVEQALIEERQCEVAYEGMDKRTEPILNPLALIQRGPVTYLVATAWDYDDILLYALHRMRSARLLETPARRPEGFDLDEWLKQGGMQFTSTGKTLRLRIQVSKELARLLEEAPLSEDMRICHQRERITVTATLPDTWQLEWWLLSQGPSVTILSPKDLRERISQALRETLNNYS